MAGACGPTAQRAGNALWGSCARDRLAPARRRPMAGLPPGGPPWRTVYGWFRKWLEQGLFDRLLGDVARRRRRAMGRRAKLRLSIIDTQSVKCIPVRGPRGYDAAKKVLGRKRVALVDADGTWLAVAVVPASVQDRDTLEALDPGKAAWPSFREAILDGAFTAASCHEWSNRHGMRHRVVERDPAQKGFVVLAGRWVVERTLAGLCIGVDCCGIELVVWTFPRHASRSPPSCPASRPYSTRCQSKTPQVKPTQTGSKRRARELSTDVSEGQEPGSGVERSLSRDRPLISSIA